MSSIRDRDLVSAKLGDFLLAEHQHAAESFLKNEESGERRATFFVSIAGGAAAVLAFAFGGDTPIVPHARVPDAAMGSALFLLGFGLLTVRRLIHRNIITDRYLFALRSLRHVFLTQEDAQTFPNAFFGLYRPFAQREISVFSVGSGGWLETIALINAVLAASATVIAVLPMHLPWHWFWPAILTFAIMWCGQMLYARRKITENVEKLMAREVTIPGHRGGER